MRDKGLEEVENFNLAYNENNKSNHKKEVKRCMNIQLVVLFIVLKIIK